jgi:putative transposase
LVRDPKDYRFCGYAEWVAGREEAILAFERLFSGISSCIAMKDYRVILYAKGALPKCADGSGSVIPHEVVHKVLESRGKDLEEGQKLCCRVRYFSDGCVLGSEKFIKEQIPLLRRMGVSRRKSEKSYPLPDLKETGIRSFRLLLEKKG